MLYKLAKSVLFQMQPETAHNVIMKNLDWITLMGLHNLVTHMPDEDPVDVMGIRFPNTVGLAAGMDKDGTRVSAFGALGFGHVEIGTITPSPSRAIPSRDFFASFLPKASSTAWVSTTKALNRSCAI